MAIAGILVRNNHKRTTLYYHGNAVPPRAYYGITPKGEYFIAVNKVIEGHQYWGAKVWREGNFMTNYASDELVAFIRGTTPVPPCKECMAFRKNETVYDNSAIRKFKGKGQGHCWNTRTITREYISVSSRIYGNSVDMNGKAMYMNSMLSDYMDGTGMCKEGFNNMDKRPMMPQFPEKSYKAK